MEVVIRQLAAQGFDRITLAVGYLSDLIAAYFQDDVNNAGVSRSAGRLPGEVYFPRWRAVALVGADTDRPAAQEQRDHGNRKAQCQDEG